MIQVVIIYRNLVLKYLQNTYFKLEVDLNLLFMLLKIQNLQTFPTLFSRPLVAAGVTKLSQGEVINPVLV